MFVKGFFLGGRQKSGFFGKELIGRKHFEKGGKILPVFTTK